MSSNLPIEIASTLQSASINRAPSPTHDLNPSTAASQKKPVQFTSKSQSPSASYIYPSSTHSEDLTDGIEVHAEDGLDGDLDDDGEGEEDGISERVLRPVPRRGSFPPLPDLRFEQSYLASISKAESNWGVAFITVRDQVRLRPRMLFGDSS